MSQGPLHPEQLQALFDGIRQNAAAHASHMQAAAARYAGAREATDAAIRGLGGPLRGAGRTTAVIAAAVAVGGLAYTATKYLRGASPQAADTGNWTDRVLQERGRAIRQSMDVPSRRQ